MKMELTHFTGKLGLIVIEMSFVDEEVKFLIRVWGEEEVQGQLEGCKRNRQVHEGIARRMREREYEKTADQCRIKMKKLKGDYRKVKDKNGETGRGKKTCKFFEDLDKVLGHRPATCPPILLESLGTGEEEEEEVEEEIREVEEDACLREIEIEEEEEEDRSRGKEKENSRRKKGKGLKRNREDRLAGVFRETMKDMWEGMMTAEEEQKEKEGRTRKRRHAKRERMKRGEGAKREFQLRLMQIMMEGQQRQKESQLLQSQNSPHHQ